MHIELAKANGFQTAIKRMAASRLGSWVLSHTLHYVDGAVIRATRGYGSLTSAIVGIPVIMLSTRGATTGKRRVVPLLGLPMGRDIILIPSNWGRSFHPAWYRNILRDPEVIISYRGRDETCVASEVEGDVLKRCWARAVEVYPGYEAYRRRASPRQIPVVLATAKES